MPNPKRRHSAARRDKRRSANFKLTAPTVVRCQSCENWHKPHHVCPSCGMYAGRTVLALRRGDAAEA